jgi:hypothetical protein
VWAVHVDDWLGDEPKADGLMSAGRLGLKPGKGGRLAGEVEPAGTGVHGTAKASEHPLPFAKELTLWALKCAHLRDGARRCEGGGEGGRKEPDTFRNQDLRRQV